MIEGILLGSASFASMAMTWRHTPDFFKRFTLRFPWLTDLGAGVLAFTLLTGFSSSLVAVVGAVTTGLLVNFMFTLLRWSGKI